MIKKMKKQLFYLMAATVALLVAVVSCSKEDDINDDSGNNNNSHTVSVAGVSLDKTSLSLAVGGSETLTATVNPADAANKNVTWSSSATGVASVDATGKVTAASAGTATITVTTQDGSKTATCNVTITTSTVAVTGVTLNTTAVTLAVGDVQTLTATVVPDVATNQNVTWSTSDATVATVSGGSVTAVKAGTATITVTTADGNRTATCTVTVTDNSSAVALEVNITGKISHTTYTVGQTGTVTFNRFPATEEEFRQVREKIGGEPHGAVALQLMAYEMYRRNRTVGEACIRLNNVTVNVTPATNRLRELFGKDAYYARPYQIAAFLKGATPANGYNPTKPYTVEVRVAPAVAYEYSNDYQNTMLYLEVFTQGKDRGSEQVAVLKTLKPGEPGEGKYFIVFNSPGLYSQVREVSFANPFNGLD